MHPVRLIKLWESSAVIKNTVSIVEVARFKVTRFLRRYE